MNVTSVTFRATGATRGLRRPRQARAPRLIAFSLLVLFALPPLPALRADSDLVNRVVALLEKRDGEEFWVTVHRLEEFGKEGVPQLRQALETGSEKARLGCAKALLQIGDLPDLEAALGVLETLAKGGKDARIRQDAIRLYGLEGDLEEAVPFLRGLLESEKDPFASIALAQVLWDLDKDTQSRDQLIDLLGSSDLHVRDEAALALAEMGYYENGVRDIVRSLRYEPTERGQRARVLDRLMQLDRQLERRLSTGDVLPEAANTAKLLEIKEQRIRELEERLDKAASDGGARAPIGSVDRLFDEVVRIIQSQYVDQAKTPREKLLVRAIAGMVGALDPYSVFMDARESTEFTQSLDGNYPGMGAHVTKKDGEPLEILRPVYGGPAYRAGILSGDHVISVDGVETADLDMERLSQLLKGPEGSKILLEVERRGRDAPFTVEIVRETIEIPSVHYESLPLGLGYIRLTQFGQHSADEFERALDLLEGTGLKGLVIDLRDNPGGRLEVAVAIADLFVRGTMPIVSQKGRNGEEDVPAIYPSDDARTGFPIVVLVNEHSASASEIVAGALQDYGRATIVGKRSYGKGSVQNLIPLRSRPGSQLKLTVRYYYLPLGRSIHTIRDDDGNIVTQGGIEPDVSVDPESIPSWRLDERAMLRDRPEILDYVDRHAEVLKKSVPLGAVDRDASFPDLEKLRDSLNTRATLDDVRAVVRYQVQRRLEDERGRQFALDLPSDRQLQAAIVELLKLVGKKPQDAPEYAWLPEALTASATASKPEPAPAR